MDDAPFNAEPWRSSIVAYWKWLEQFDVGLVKRFLKRLDSRVSKDVEATVGEAVVWDWLASRVQSIEVAESLSHGGPDFRCLMEDGSFLVEATNVAIETATQRTGLEEIHFEPSFYSPLTRVLRSRAEGKAGQFEDLHLPLVVFVTTFHWHASVVCVDKSHVESLLTGTPFISSTYCRATGNTGRPTNSVDFFDSLFVSVPKIIGDDVRAIRRNISAVIVAGFGVAPPKVPVYGVLHPSPVREFDPAWLSDVPFCKLRTWPPGRTVEVEWVQSV